VKSIAETEAQQQAGDAVEIEGSILDISLTEEDLVRVVLNDGTGTALAYMSAPQAGALLQATFNLAALKSLGALKGLEDLLRTLIGRPVRCTGKLVDASGSSCIEVTSVEHARRDFAAEAAQLLEDADEELEVEIAIDANVPLEPAAAEPVLQDQAVAVPEQVAEAEPAPPEEAVVEPILVPVVVEPLEAADVRYAPRWSGRFQRETLLKLVKLASPLVDEVKLRVGGPGEPILQAKTVDPAHVAMVEVTLDRSAARDVVVPMESFDVGVDLDKLAAMLAAFPKPAKPSKTDPLEGPCQECSAAALEACRGRKGPLQKVHTGRRDAAKAIDAAKADDAEYSILVEIVGGKEGKEEEAASGLFLCQGTLQHRIATIDPSGMPTPKVPNLTLPASADVNLGEALAFIKAASGVSDHLQVVVTRGPDGTRMKMRAEGDKDHVDWASRLAASIDDGQPEVKSLYSLDYWGNMFKAMGSAGSVANMRLGTGYPARLSVSDAGVSAVYLLAPRIPEDEERSWHEPQKPPQPAEAEAADADPEEEEAAFEPSEDAFAAADAFLSRLECEALEPQAPAVPASAGEQPVEASA